MGNVIENAVKPVIEELGWEYQAMDETTLATGFVHEFGYADVVISEERYRLRVIYFPRLKVTGSKKNDVAELLLGFSWERVMIKPMRVIKDGEIAFEVELPTDYGSLDKSAFGRYFILGVEQFKDAWRSIICVVLADSSPQEALDRARLPFPPKEEKRPVQRTKRQSRAEREIDEIVRESERREE